VASAPLMEVFPGVWEVRGVVSMAGEAQLLCLPSFAPNPLFQWAVVEASVGGLV